jgi:hypothetical protein
MNKQHNIAILERLADVLDSLKITYAVGGSLASSVYGTVRFTQDADITVEPFGPVADKFCGALKDDFYISAESMRQALQDRSSFNVIHFATAFKIDIFVRAENEFEEQMLSRSRKLRLGESRKAVSFVSAEDIILLKLRWFRQAEGTSERQWSDVHGVLAGQAGGLDLEYLNSWANKLGLADLLEKAISESKT